MIASPRAEQSESTALAQAFLDTYRGRRPSLTVSLQANVEARWNRPGIGSQCEDD